MIHVQTLDRKIWRKDLLLVYLYDCYNKNVNAVIDFTPEGSCAESMGLYKLLDEFCTATGYSKNRITIKTANMIESHPEYVISKQSGYWYEIIEIQQWLNNKTLDIQYAPTKHFANFSSRSNWFRLWIATFLDTYYKDKTVQTYHYDPNQENYNANGYIGIDDLFKYGCDLIPEAVRFIQSCPRTLDLVYLKTTTGKTIFQHSDSYYPIQHPNNLNLLQYYNDIFVDVVVEPNVSGTCFLVTEKLWRCIVARRPFIVVSNVEYLRNLRKLGFKTFNQWWDESYDMYGSQQRIKHVCSVLNVISELTKSDIECILLEMKDLLDHNYTVFKSLTPSDVDKAFNV